MTVEETSTTTTKPTIIVKVGTTESFIAGLMGTATTQVQIASQKFKITKMRQCFRTEQKEVQGGANDG
eukprot:5467688-Ditylum_brightwellii.AAC.2